MTDTNPLALALKQARMTEKELSEKAGISPSYISRLRRGERGITEAVAAKLAPFLNVSPDYLTRKLVSVASKPPSASVAFEEIMDVLLDVAQGDLSLAEPKKGKLDSPKLKRKVVTTSQDEPNSDLTSWDDVRSAVAYLISKSAANSHVHAFIEGFQPNPPHLPNYDCISELHSAIDKLLVSQKSINMIFRLGHSPENDRHILAWALKHTIRYKLLGLAQLFTVEYLKGKSIHRFPRDIWYSEAAYVDAFPRLNEFTIEQGTFIKGFHPAIRRYIDLIRRHASPNRIEVALPDEIRLASDILTRKTIMNTKLVQPFLTSATRPISDYNIPWSQEGVHSLPQDAMSSWLKRMVFSLTGKKPDEQRITREFQAEIEEISDHYIKRGAKFIDECTSERFQQIVDAPTLTAWAQSGKRIDVGADDIFLDSATERVARLDHTIRLLEVYDNFEVTVHENLLEDTGLLRCLRQNDSASAISWIVEGSVRLGFSFATRSMSIAKRPASWVPFEQTGRGRIVAFLENQDLAQSFVAKFDDLWNLQERTQRKRNSIEFLRSLREQAMSARV